MKSPRCWLEAICMALAFLAVACAGQETSGIGVALGEAGGDIVVKLILPNSPAANHRGIHMGDKVLAIAQGDQPALETKGKKLAEVVALVRGPKGSTVRLTLVPAGKADSEARVISLVRGELEALSKWGDGVLLAKGTPAPDIRLKRLSDGKAIALSSFKGKVVVLEFWATWCGPCQEQMAKMQRLMSEHPAWKDKVTLISASVDEDKQVLLKHLKSRDWNHTLNTHVADSAIQAFHVDGLPTTYVIDADGKVFTGAHVLDVPAEVNRCLDR